MCQNMYYRLALIVSSRSGIVAYTYQYRCKYVFENILKREVKAWQREQYNREAKNLADNLLAYR